ncbi:hypothetical protein DNHGIG_04280 [Collibacillus ludicampi]|uniref:C-type cytochrome biogenesis protein CcmI n=1 Tax=Collibacillus ludicampi TaxID=2771369 RepID=A0AAV4LAJ5_9BACL|nr:hypothetical protein [Collibacillus ludicampi]GIM44879.1 hypothetical protein DNHGIG_04280 [Collibacillus ludicampi]
MLQTTVGFVALIVVFLLISPFFSKKNERLEDQDKSLVNLAEKEAIYTEFVDLEYDYMMGKITEHEYKTMKEHITSLATNVARRERSLFEAAEDAIEQEIRQEVEKSLRNDFQGARTQSVRCNATDYQT